MGSLQNYADLISLCMATLTSHTKKSFISLLKSTSDKKTIIKNPFLWGRPFWKIVLNSFEFKIVILVFCNIMQFIDFKMTGFREMGLIEANFNIHTTMILLSVHTLVETCSAKFLPSRQIYIILCAISPTFTWDISL